MLSAKDGNIINTSTNRSLINISFSRESGVSGPGAVTTVIIPNMPNVMEAIINILVAIFCTV